MDVDIDFAPLIIVTCCILHNIAEKNKMPFRSTWNEPLEETARAYPQPSNPNVSCDVLSVSGIRDTLKNYIAENLPIVQSNRF